MVVRKGEALSSLPTIVAWVVLIILFLIGAWLDGLSVSEGMLSGLLMPLTLLHLRPLGPIRGQGHEQVSP